MKNLSEKSLNRVWDWAEENEDTPLGRMYMAACGCVGSLEAGDDIVQQVVGGKYPPKDKRVRKRWWRVWDAAWEARDMAFNTRDAIGRIILDMLNRK